MDRSRIALVIPALNEAASIAAVVARCLEHGFPIVVDDGSTDATAEIARASGADVLIHTQTRGYDGALNSGFQRASELGCEFVLTLDADGQHDPRTLSTLIKELRDGADIVVGVRDRRQRLAECLFAWWAQWMWRIHDPLCGMKGYQMARYHEHGCFDSCASVGTELAICAAVRGYKIREVPVSTVTRDGAARFGNSIRANLRIFRALIAVTRKAFLLGRSRGDSRIMDRRD